jgi:hypothetical protein
MQIDFIRGVDIHATPISVRFDFQSSIDQYCGFTSALKLDALRRKTADLRFRFRFLFEVVSTNNANVVTSDRVRS